MDKDISRRRFCKNASLATMGLALGAACSERIVNPDTRALKAPAVLNVDEDDGEIRLTWEASDDPQFSHFNLYRDSGISPLATLTTVVYSDTAVVNGTEYTYHLTIVDENGTESPRKSASGTPLVLPVIPVTRVTAANALTGDPASTVDYTVVKEMVFAGIRDFSGNTDTGLAFESFFPGLTAATTIGIKVNTLTGLTTSPQMAFAVAEGLLQMLGGTYPLANITVFDYDKPANNVLAAAGFTAPETYSPALNGLTIKGERKADFTGTAVSLTETQQILSPTLLACDYIINMPVLKDHTNAGITFSLKNFYGCIDKPEQLHDANGNLYCNPAIVQLNSMPQIKNKVKLIVGDCLFIVPNGGPASGSYTSTPQALLIGTDPVAVDFFAFDLINAERQAKGFSQISLTDIVANHKPAAYLKTAYKPPYSLGSKKYSVSEVTA